MIRFPLTTVFSKTTNATVSTDSTFVLPNYDFDSITAKFTAASFSASEGSTFKCYIQTTDDGGTTFYDCARFSLSTTNGTITNANAKFINIPVSVGTAAYIGNTSSGSITTDTVSGLPFLSNSGRVRWTLTNCNTAVISVTISLLANNQSGGY